MEDAPVNRRAVSAKNEIQVPENERRTSRIESFLSLLAMARSWVSWLNLSVDIGVVRCPSALINFGLSAVVVEKLFGTENESEP